MPDSFTFRIDEQIRKALEKQATDEDRSLAYLVNRYLREGLKTSGYLPAEKDENKTVSIS